MSFQSVLCGVDFSPQSGQALRLAGAVARHEGATLIVVSVVHPLLVEAAAAAYSRDYLTQETQAELAEFTRSMLGSRPGEAPRIVTRIGDPADEMLEAAAEHTADLIVVGTHGLTGYKKLFFGSTAQRLLRHTTIDTLVVPPRPQTTGADTATPFGTGPVVAALDLTVGTERIATLASRVASAYRLPLILVHVAAEKPAEHRTDRIEEARQELERIASGLGAGAAQRLVVIGEPAAEIVRISIDEGAALIVLGLAGAHQSVTHRPGSTAYGVLCRSAIPVLAVARPA